MFNEGEKSCPQTTTRNVPYLGECTSWSRNEYCLWHEPYMQDSGGHSFPVAHSHCSLKLTSSVLMSLKAKLPLTPNLMLSRFHSNFLFSLRLNRYVLAPSHLFRISGYWWIVYPEEQCKLNFPFWVCKEVILKFRSEISFFSFFFLFDSTTNLWFWITIKNNCVIKEWCGYWEI